MRALDDGYLVRRLALPALAIFLGTVRVAVVASILVHLSGEPAPEGYVERFTEIAATDDRLYREHPVEYPPLTVAAIELVGDEDVSATATRLVWFVAAADLIVVASLLFGWGGIAAVAYLAISLPALGAIYRTLDSLPVAFAIAGVALSVRLRERWGGIALAAAVLSKLWPVAVVPGLLVWGRRRALSWAVGSLVVGTAVWIAWAGPQALDQVATQRDSPGWESESTVGTLVRLLGDEEVRIVKDSPRVGSAPVWAKGLLTVATALGIAAVWWRAARAPHVRIGEPALAAVALLLFFSPIYSYPYILWLVPWAAIAVVEGRRLLPLLAATVVVVTATLYSLLQQEALRDTLSVAYLILVLRNLLTAAIPAVYLLGSREVNRQAGEPEPVAP